MEARESFENEWRMEDYFVSYFGNWKVWKKMQVEWKIIVTREGKGLLRIMNGEWKIILYRILEIGKFRKGCKQNGRLL